MSLEIYPFLYKTVHINIFIFILITIHKFTGEKNHTLSSLIITTNIENCRAIYDDDNNIDDGHEDDYQIIRETFGNNKLRSAINFQSKTYRSYPHFNLSIEN